MPIAMTRLGHLVGLRRFRRLAAAAAVIAGIWLLISLVTATQDFFAAMAEGREEQWLSAFRYTFTVNTIWTTFTPIIIWLTAKFPLTSDKVWRSILAHMGAGLVIATLNVALYVFLFGAAYQAELQLDGRFALFVRKFIGSVYVNLLTYGVIVGLVSAIHAYHALKAEQVARAQAHEQLAHAEASALRARLQPHFLFNALNTISALVRTEPLVAERIVARLGDLLRMSIADLRAPETTLAEELEFTDAFLAIEELRLGDRLKILRDIDAEALSARLPSLVLQPIVENAIRHGIAPRVEGGVLRIQAKRTDKMLHLRVEDDGVGADVVQEGVGLGTTRQRLAQQFGSAAEVIVTCAKGAGFSVSIGIPQ